jgi:hypothetical protein
LEVGKEEYKAKLVFDIGLDKKNVTDLSKGSILIPFLEEIKEKRQQISS